MQPIQLGGTAPDGYGGVIDAANTCLRNHLLQAAATALSLTHSPSDKLEARPREYGEGVFATEDFEPHTLVLPFSGVVHCGLPSTKSEYKLAYTAQGIAIVHTIALLEHVPLKAFHPLGFRYSFGLQRTSVAKKVALLYRGQGHVYLLRY